MTMTIGQLVASLFANYDRKLHDEELAAVATEIRVSELLSRKARSRRDGGRAKAA
ncbi:MAG: hypothetical protein AB7T06_01210 [Kofleriaceae bacterium]